VTVHVGELSTELAVENGQAPSPASAPEKSPGWAERDKARETMEILACTLARTAAEGFDD
jgi:hypothetical protein